MRMGFDGSEAPEGPSSSFVPPASSGPAGPSGSAAPADAEASSGIDPFWSNIGDGESKQVIFYGEVDFV